MKLKNNKDRLIYLLKTRGPQTANTLASIIEITSMGVRQFLEELESEKLVEHFNKKQGRGRPKKYWQLTDNSHAKFPDRHADVTLSLIENVKEFLGDKALEQLIEKREEKILKHYVSELSKCDSLKAKIEKLVELRSEEGYMAEYTSDGDGFVLIENHCPICVAATSCQNFCKSELSVFRQVLAADVNRCEYLIDGDRRCAYKINKFVNIKE